MGINVQGFQNINSTNGINQVKNSKGKITLDLNKGIKLDLSKEMPELQKIRIGAGWKAATGLNQENIDLDLFALVRYENGNLRDVSDIIYFNQKNTNKGIELLGDNRKGHTDTLNEEDDDEVMLIDIKSIPKDAKIISLFVNIHDAERKQQNFSKVKDSYIRLINEETNEEKAIYRLQETTDALSFNAFHFIDLEVHPQGLVFSTIGEGLNGDIQEIANQYC